MEHIDEENKTIQEAMNKPDADEAFKSSAQSFLDELGNISQTTLLPFFDAYAPTAAADSDEFPGNFSVVFLSARMSFPAS